MILFAQIWSWIEAIPATFWGVLAGSFFSLGGVVLSNRAGDRRLRQQLEHDRQLKDREREMSLRKDVYLAAAEAVSAGFTSLGSFANLDIPEGKLTEAYLQKVPAIAKVHVIAREGTARTMAKFTGELSAALLRAAAQRLPLLAQKHELNALGQMIAGFGKERDRMLELMTQYNIDGLDDKNRWNILNHNFEFEHRRIDETVTKRDELARALYASQLSLMTDCMAESARLSRLLLPVVAAVRQELELPLDEQAYAEVIEEGLRLQEANVREFVEKIQAAMTPHETEPVQPTPASPQAS